MPIKRRSQTQRASSVVQSNVLQSTMTSLKTVSYQRNSSGQLVETWSSPGFELTSPQTWVPGLQAEFLSPPKSPSPKRRITRRSSVYVQPLWDVKPPAGLSGNLEFKVPSASTDHSSRTRRSSVYQKSGLEPSTSRRSSVYTRRGKDVSVRSTLLEVEEAMSVAPQKNVKQASAVGEASMSFSISESKTIVSAGTTRARKRNIAETEKAMSPMKPAAKRSRQQLDKDNLTGSSKRSNSAKSEDSKELPKKLEPSLGKNTPKTPVGKTRTAKSGDKVKVSHDTSLSKTRTPRSSRKSGQKQVTATEQENANVTVKDVSTPKSAQDLKRKSKSETPVGKAHTAKAEDKVKVSHDTSLSKTRTPRSSRKSGQKRVTTTEKENANVTMKDVTTPKSDQDLKRKSKSKTPVGKAHTAKAEDKVKVSHDTSLSKTRTSRSSRKSGQKQARTTEQENANVTMKDVSTPKSDQDLKRKSKSKTPPVGKTKTAKAGDKMKVSHDTSLSKTRTPRSSRKSGQKQVTTGEQENANVTMEDISTPKSDQDLKRKSKSETKSAKTSRSAKSSKSSGRSSKKSTRANTAKNELLEGFYLQISGQQTDVTAVSEKSSFTEKGTRSLKGENIFSMAMHSTPRLAQSAKKLATPKRLQNAQKSATLKSEKKRSAVTKKGKLSQDFVSSPPARGTSSRMAPKDTLIDASPKPMVTKTRGVKRRLTPSRDFPDGESQLAGTSLNLNAANYFQSPSQKSSSLASQFYCEEKTFSQFVEHRSGSGVERYGTQAVEQKVGDQAYRAGSFLIKREKASGKEEEEGRWENVNNSALSISENPNTTFSTSSYSNRCIIL